MADKQLKEYSNAADVDYKAIPSDVYGIIAKILLRETAKRSESDDNTTSPAAAEQIKEFW